MRTSGCRAGETRRRYGIRAVLLVGSGDGSRSNHTAERALEEFGCRVERIAGRDDEETGRILADMAEKGRRFVKFDVDF